MRGNLVAPVITLDGPSGSGKGTVSLRLAQKFSFKLLDSGALYRVLALAAQKHSVNLANEAALKVLAEHLDVQFSADKSILPNVILEGEDVTDVIRTESIGNLASIIAVLPTVRAALLSRQRAFRELPGLIADGRDMGTVVFPDALLKVYLFASEEERALRRFNQLKEQGKPANLSQLTQEIRERDSRDQNRVVAPLRPAKDAVMITTDHLEVEQVVELILQEAKKKAVSRGTYLIEFNTLFDLVKNPEEVY